MVIFWGATIIDNYVHTIVGFLANYIDNRSWMGAGVFMVLAVLSVMFVFFSSIWLVPIALLAWGNTLTAIMLFSSWLLGGIFSYLI